jgi:hypothetical protein
MSMINDDKFIPFAMISCEPIYSLEVTLLLVMGQNGLEE